MLVGHGSDGGHDTVFGQVPRKGRGGLSGQEILPVFMVQ